MIKIKRKSGRYGQSRIIAYDHKNNRHRGGAWRLCRRHTSCSTWSRGHTHGWIITDERMETSIPEVYAIGDVLGPQKLMLAHVASAEGSVAAENAVGGNRKMSYNIISGAIFTMPEVANFGLIELRPGNRDKMFEQTPCFFETWKRHRS